MSAGSRMALRNVSLAIAAIVSLSASACSSFPESGGPPPRLATRATDLGSLIYVAAEALADRAPTLSKRRPIVVATMVSVDDLNRSSTFGRLTSQLISDRLSQFGFLIEDETYMHALALSPATGELVLSRDAASVSESADAQAVVTGTYAVAGEEIILNIRLLRADNGQVLSSADVVVPLDNNTAPLVNVRNSSIN